tara:strand:- start:9508 stop:9744 length:237 start_codon:yes stop_codon:yes gene_type:complete
MVTGRLQQVVRFYQEQLQKFKKIGIGNKTEFDVVVTDKLINVTIKRLRMLADKRYRLLSTAKAGLRLKKHMEDAIKPT